MLTDKIFIDLIYKNLNRKLWLLSGKHAQIPDELNNKQPKNVTTGRRTFTCRLHRQPEVVDDQHDARWPAIITDNRKCTTADAAFPDNVKRTNNKTN